jgi:hypothetical protein
VREESHLDDMRAAIRGDFERLQERRGEQELMRVGEPEPEPETEHAPEPAPEPEPEPEPDSSEDASTDTAPAAEPEPAAEAAQRAPAQRSWLDRLLGR